MTEAKGGMELEKVLELTRDGLASSLHGTLKEIANEIQEVIDAKVDIRIGLRQPAKNYGLIRIDIAIETGRCSTIAIGVDDSICYPNSLG